MLYIFDMGNVVIKGIDVLDSTIKLLGVNAEEFICDYNHYVFPLMDGTISIDKYYRHVEHAFGVKIETNPIKDFFNPYFNMPMVEVLDKLREKGNRVVCASNTYKPHADKLKEVGFFNVFDKSYLSHEIGLTKPSSAFFEYVLRQENTKPCDAFFTDDYKENIDGAEKLGIKCFWYKKDFDDSKLKEVYGL